MASRAKSDSLRGQLDTAREQLASAERTNRELEVQLGDCQNRLEQCSYVLADIRETNTRSVNTIRDCIEIIEEQRYAIMCISYYVDNTSSDDLYNWVDSWLESEGVEFIK